MTTKKLMKRFNLIDEMGLISEYDAKMFPGIHFCADWDYLLIWNGLPDEMACCTCFNYEDKK